MKIVVLDAYAGNPGDLSWDEVRKLGDCDIYDRTAPELVIDRARDAEAVLTNKVPLHRKEIEALPKLKYIGVMATGFNVVDIDAASQHGITVTNVPAYSSASVAQLVFAHLLNMCDSVQHYSQEVHAGKWCHCADFTYVNTPIIELAGKTMGIVGLGHIGQAVARIALAMDMRVQAFTSKPQQALPAGVAKVELDSLFATSDVVTLHCPLNASTRNMVDARRLKLMKPTAMLINTARGPLVDEAALAQALKSGQLMAAGIDVMSKEPPAADNPLLAVDNCYITPHIAWASKEARVRLLDVVTANLKAYLAGKPVNVVSP